MGLLRKRIVAMALLALLLTVAVAACGSDSSSTDEGTESAPESTEGAPESTGGGDESIPDIAFTGFESKLPKCYADPKAEPLKIGYASPSEVNEATATLAKVIENEVKELGGTLVKEDAKSEPDRQVTQIQRLFASGVDALIVFPVDPSAVAAVMKQGEASGIPVLAINADNNQADPGPGYDTQVLWKAGEAGYLDAKHMAELVPQGSEVAQMKLIVPVGVIERLIGEAKHYAEEFGLKPVALVSNETDDIAGGEKAMSGLLGESPNIKGLMAYNDESATGAYAAARSQGKEIALLGGNGGALAYSSIESGKIDGSHQYPIVDIGRCAVKGAYDLAQGTKVPIAVGPGEVKVLDEETIGEDPTWDEQIEEIYGTGE